MTSWPLAPRHTRGVALLLAACLASPARADGADQPRQLLLCAPLTTMVRAAQVPPEPERLCAELVVGDDAPADLGIGAYTADGHGRWYRSRETRALGPGRHLLDFDLSAQAELVCEPGRAGWNAVARGAVRQAGLFLWSAKESRAAITIVRLEVVGAGAPTSPATVTVTPVADPAAPAAPAAVDAPAAAQLADLRLDGMEAGGEVMRWRTGARWTLDLRPHPFPAQPEARERFALDAIITTPDGQQLRLGGFYRQPLALVDQGDREAGVPLACACYSVRFRPELPGTYHIRLEAAWDGAPPALAVRLPDLVVEGEPWDDYVRADPDDPRFFSTGSRIDHRRFYWPIGLNLHSVWDLRTRGCCRTILTPGRLWNAYEAYLRRFAAAGGSAVEIWLCSWGLALEWRGEWTEFHGLGRYSEENAERLDRVLDLAWSLGIRVNLVINNHGQASVSADREWDVNPWNSANGGPLAQAAGFFTETAALNGQERMRRYIIARWADHPAVLGWKLWSEQNLTAGGASLRAWHVHAVERWRALDHYGHGVTTHWAGDYRSPDRGVVEQPGLDYVCIDAYHPRTTLLAQLLWDGSNAGDSMVHYGKPILVTEYGGTAGAGPQPQIIAEHHSGHFAALVAGNSGSPMLWWFEWVDQREQWSPYTAIARFAAGEDLRGQDAASLVLSASGGAGELWARAWARPGRLLGYVLDRDWGQLGEVERQQRDAVLHLGARLAPGRWTLEWWDAESGERTAVSHLDHHGGDCDLALPAFSHHLAFKLIAEPPAPTAWH